MKIEFTKRQRRLLRRNRKTIQELNLKTKEELLDYVQTLESEIEELREENESLKRSNAQRNRGQTGISYIKTGRTKGIYVPSGNDAKNIRILQLIGPYIRQLDLRWVGEMPVEQAFIDFVIDLATSRVNKRTRTQNGRNDYERILGEHWDIEKIINDFTFLGGPDTYVPYWIDMMLDEGLFKLSFEADD